MKLFLIFFIFMALQNGLHEFKKQAYLIAVYSVSKLACVILFVSIFNSLTGAFIANIAGSFIGLIYGLYYWQRTRLPSRPSSFQWSELFKFAWPIAIFSLAINFHAARTPFSDPYPYWNCSVCHFFRKTIV